MAEDELLSFLEEDPDLPDLEGGNRSQDVWNILIVDDDVSVHSATRLAIEGLFFEGRSLVFISAYSADEAQRVLQSSGHEIAVILLDVVMESEDAGLKLVSIIRDVLHLKLVRIILRTGQPGYAPEISTIQQLDINDYKSKSELTRSGLFTALTAGIRSFAQLHQLERSRQGLEKIVQASCDLSRLRSLNVYAEGAVLQICSLLGVSDDGLVCVQEKEDQQDEPLIVAAAGMYAGLINQPLSALPSSAMREALGGCLTERINHIGELTTLHFDLGDNRSIAACIRTNRILPEIDQQLLQAFCASITVGFDNVLMNERLEAEAFLDPLLGIPNRSGFERIIIYQQQQHSSSLLMLVDIDDFSAINSTLDQHYGDDVLRAVCQRIQLIAGDSSVLGRISGDCFALVGPMTNLDCETILHSFNEPFDIHGSQLMLSVTCGVVRLFEENSSASATELLKDANIALKQAKIFSRGKIQYFVASLRKAAEERISLLNGLREAFSAQHLLLHYQPQIDLVTGKLVGAEALLRWRTASGSFVPPDQFIPLAEQSGIIAPIGTWVLKTACRHTRQLIDLGFNDFRMAVNVSHSQLRDPNFLLQLEAILMETGVPGKNLEIELTESIAIDDIDLLNGLLGHIHTLGASIALDDFGTGYSSLSLLSRLAVDRLKIDKAFINSLLTDDLDSQLPRVMIHLARDFRLSTIAEGIENNEQMQVLTALGCDEGQGFHIARPMPIEELVDWAKNHASD